MFVICKICVTKSSEILVTSKLLTVLDFSLKKGLLGESTLTIDLGVARVRCKPC